MSNVPSNSPPPRVSHGAGEAAPDAPPLTEAHFAMVRQAGVRRRKLTHAARIAWSSSAVILCVGIPAFLFAAILRDWADLLLASAICAVGAVEFAGHRRMRGARARAGKMLGINQLAFLTIIVLYCVVQMCTFSTEKVKASAVSPEFRSQLNLLPNMQQTLDSQIERWAPILTYGFYSLVILVSVCAQGGLAAYYFTRDKHVESFNRDTAGWIRRIFVEIGQ